jgi:putative flavoprotein involved in K+ transport
LPISDAVGEAVHRNGATSAPGACLSGLPWLRKQQSSFLSGVGEDAEQLADGIGQRPRGQRGA